MPPATTVSTVPTLLIGPSRGVDSLDWHPFGVSPEHEEALVSTPIQPSRRPKPAPRACLPGHGPPLKVSGRLGIIGRPDHESADHLACAGEGMSRRRPSRVRVTKARRSVLGGILPILLRRRAGGVTPAFRPPWTTVPRAAPARVGASVATPRETRTPKATAAFGGRQPSPTTATGSISRPCRTGTSTSSFGSRPWTVEPAGAPTAA